MGADASHAVAPGTYQVPNTINFMTGDDLAYDGPNYWSRSPVHQVDRIKIPTFLVGGWFDLFQRGDPLLFEELQKRRVPVKLVMGPWDHLRGPWSGPLSSDAEWTQRLSELALRWFVLTQRPLRPKRLRSPAASLSFITTSVIRRHWFFLSVERGPPALGGSRSTVPSEGSTFWPRVAEEPCDARKPP